MEDIGLGKGLKGISINKALGLHGTDVIRLLVLLWAARKLQDEEGFFYPRNLHFCGRAHQIHQYVNHLGADMCRGILQFAEG